MKSYNIMLSTTLFFIVFILALILQSCNEIRPDSPTIMDKTQYVDYYCVQNNTSYCVKLENDIELKETNSSASAGMTSASYLTLGHMECIFINVNDRQKYDGKIEIPFRHRFSMTNTAYVNQINIALYDENIIPLDDTGWYLKDITYKTSKEGFLKFVSIQHNDSSGMFYTWNYENISLDEIGDNLFPYDKQLLDKYLTQVEPGHVRLHVFSLTDEYLAKE